MTSIAWYPDLIGTEGRDVLRGEPGAQLIDGRGGNDRIVLDQLGFRNIDGGAGSDTIIYRTSQDLYVHMGDGVARKNTLGILPEPIDVPDPVEVTGPDGTVIEIIGPIIPPLPQPQDSFSNIERLVTGDGNDIVCAADTGSKISTRGGDDRAVGGAGRDRLFTGDGDDHLIDGGGRDMMIGGAGADTFMLVLDGDRDTIRDFDGTEDTLDLRLWGVGSFDDLDVSTRGNWTVVRYEDEVLAMRGTDIDLDEGSVATLDDGLPIGLL